MPVVLVALAVRCAHRRIAPGGDLCFRISHMGPVRRGDAFLHPADPFRGIRQCGQGRGLLDRAHSCRGNPSQHAEQPHRCGDSGDGQGDSAGSRPFRSWASGFQPPASFLGADGFRGEGLHAFQSLDHHHTAGSLYSCSFCRLTFSVTAFGTLRRRRVADDGVIGSQQFACGYSSGRRSAARGQGRELQGSKRKRTHCLVGESGCGKSLTALAVMNLLPKRAQRSVSSLLFNGNRSLIGQRTRDVRNPREQDEYDFPGAHDLAESLLHHRQPTGRGPVPAQEDHRRGSQGTSRVPARQSRHHRGRKPAQAVPASALRRPSPTDDDRHGPHVRPRPDHRGTNPQRPWTSPSRRRSWPFSRPCRKSSRWA